MPIGHVKRSGPPEDPIHPPTVDTIEAVELHLRADKNLSGEDAEALANLFRIAYDRFRIPRAGDGS
jgi:hypothetical protein